MESFCKTACRFYIVLCRYSQRGSESQTRPGSQGCGRTARAWSSVAALHNECRWSGNSRAILLVSTIASHICTVTNLAVRSSETCMYRILNWLRHGELPRFSVRRSLETRVDAGTFVRCFRVSVHVRAGQLRETPVAPQARKNASFCEA